jgi:formylglycine-generating enzyme required for sulfatase activity
VGDADLQAFLDRLPQLHEQLGREGMSAGADTWLAIHDLLLRLARQGRLPADPLDLAALIGPVVCRSPAQQRRFPGLYREWWTGQATPTRDALTHHAVPAAERWQEQIRRFDRRWSRGLAALLLLMLLGLLAIALWPPDPIKGAPDVPPVAPSPAAPVKKTPPPKKTREIPIVDQAPPNRLPFPGDLAVRQQLDIIGRWLPWLPALPLLFWLIRRYRRHWILDKSPAKGENLGQHLRLRLPHPLFGGEAANGALSRLRASRWLPTRRLDSKATVNASARAAGFFEPRYHDRRETPHYLVLVRARHTHDQGADFAEELITRFHEQGLPVEGFRFIDDPVRLVPWTHPDRPPRTLDQLAREWPEARLIIISEGDIIAHPHTGQDRPWLDRAETWMHRAWLNPAPFNPALCERLWRRDFLLLPLAGASLEPLSHWLAGWGHRPRTHPPEADTRLLPPALRNMPQRWLDAGPPYGEDIDALTADLRDFLEPDGWLLLQAIAAYPEARWKLTQALDFLLFEQQPDPANPPGGREVHRREQRLTRLGRLPWVRHGHFPDYLREHWLKNLAGADRDRIKLAYETLLRPPAGSQGALELPIARPSRRGLRRLLLDALRRRSPARLDDPIFLNLLLGDPLSRLDFHLPRALARLLPGGQWRINPWPALTALAMAAGLGWSLAGLWDRWGRDSLADVWQRSLDADNAGWPVRLRATAGAGDLASALRDSLAAHRYPVSLDAAAAEATLSRNRVVHPPGAEDAAQHLAGYLRHLSYGASVDRIADPAGSTIQVDLVRTYADPRQEAAAFNDALAFEVFHDSLKDGGQGPALVTVPAGRFQMGSPADEPDRSDDEGPRHAVTLRAFALGQTEVTFDDYDRFARATGHPLPDDGGWGRGARPVINVAWADAAAYAAWLSAQTGRAYRLPTEAEWEYACQAGQAGHYCGGDDPDAVAWFRQNAGGRTQPVGQKAANAWGLRDLSGNVWEWTADCWHDNYTGAPADGGAWQETGGGDCGRRVVRGGSWGNGPGNLRSANRVRDSPDVAGGNLGFRVARAW